MAKSRQNSPAFTSPATRIAALLVAVAGVAAVLLAAASAATAVPTQQSNLLENPSLEDPYSSEGAAGGWGRWHEESPDPGECSGPYAFRPFWSRETNGALVLDGSVSQHVGNQFDTWNAGILQTVPVQAGSTYRFSFWALGRASNQQFGEAPSDAGVNLGVQAGIDPNGSGLWTDGDLVWGAAGSPHDTGDQSNWQQFAVEATATGNEVTVFIRADLKGANQCRAHLDVWFDNAQLVEAGPPPTDTPPPQPTSPPQPTAPPATNTPVPPTATPTSEATPTDTPQPTATPSDTPEPRGTICVNAFSDDNSNGQHEETEGAMAGVTFTIAQEGTVLRTGISTGPEPVCFDDLQPGGYQVAQSVPNTLQMTTGASTEVTVGEGQTLEVKFGSRQRPAEEISESDPAGEDGEAQDDDEETVVTVDEGEQAPRSLLAISGLVALFVAIVLLGGLIFMVLRQRR